MKPPEHDRRIKGPKGDKRTPIGAIVHTTEMAPRKGSGDRHDIVDFLARKGISIPVVTDPGGDSTIMVPLGYLGDGHARGLSGKAWGIEQVGFAGWSKKEWAKPGKRKMVATTGRWAAWVLAELMDLPVTKRNLRRFIVGHDRDHKLGGTSDHWDPGPNYPWGAMRQAAMAYAGERETQERTEGKKITVYRVTATKDDKRRARSYRVKLPRRSWAWIRKMTKKGWTVVVRRQKKADLS